MSTSSPQMLAILEGSKQLLIVVIEKWGFFKKTPVLKVYSFMDGQISWKIHVENSIFTKFMVYSPWTSS